MDNVLDGRNTRREQIGTVAAILVGGNSEHQGSDSGYGEKDKLKEYLDGITDVNLIRCGKVREAKAILLLHLGKCCCL